jgi:large subunit ribosomal protein L9
MQLILREDVQDLGRTGDVVNVSPGYARNYLIPQALAVEATRRNLRQLEHQKRVMSKRAEQQRQRATELGDRIDGLNVTVEKPVGESDRLYGSVTGRDIVGALVVEGFKDVDKKRIVLNQPIRQLGIHPVSIRLSGDRTVQIKVWVVAKV